MRRLLPLLVGVAFAASCSHNMNLERPQTQENFGVRMAKENLWREAMFRFQRAVQIDPSDARAHNNLAVAYEANGDFEKARKEYLEALKLDRTNQYIQKNYSRYVEFLSRNRKRQAKESAVANKPAPPVSTGAKTTDAGMPEKPTGAEPPPSKPPGPPVAPPVDLPPQPPAKPPGGAL